jgi:hypothetical protein
MICSYQDIGSVSFGYALVWMMMIMMMVFFLITMLSTVSIATVTSL